MQLVVHTLTGIATAFGYTKLQPRARDQALAYGLIVGAALPDFDTFAVVFFILGGIPVQQAISLGHHVVLHNLLAVAVLALVGGLLVWRLPRAGKFFLGLAVGVVAHLAVDSLVGQNSLLWPFSNAHFGLYLLDIPRAYQIYFDLHLELAIGALFFACVWFVARRAGDALAKKSALVSLIYTSAVLLYAIYVALTMPNLTFEASLPPFLALLAVPYIVMVVAVGMLFWRVKTVFLSPPPSPSPPTSTAPRTPRARFCESARGCR